MDTVIQYVTTLLLERGIELVLLLAMIGLWRWLSNRKLRDRIKVLEEAQTTAPAASEPLEPADARQSETRTLWLASPGAGRIAAELIAKAPDLAAARQVWEGYRAALRQTDLRWAYWAFATRLEKAGDGQEISGLTQVLLLDADMPVDALDPDEELKAQVNRWVEGAE